MIQKKTIDRELRRTEITRVLELTLVANVAIVIAKIVAGISAHALSVVADAAHSGVDATNNILALVLARVAAQEADEEHPYGHGKFETLGALAAVAFFSITIYQLVTSAVERLIAGGSHARATPLVIVVMTISAIMALAISRFEAKRGHELNSELLIADSAHTRSDLYASVAVLVGLGFVAAGFPWADPIFTLVIAALIAHTGYAILKTTVPVLVDERAVDVQTIRRIALATGGVVDCYNVRSRGREGEIFAELTISCDGSLDVERAHAIADSVEHRVASEVGAREVVVHVEPETTVQQAQRTR